MEKTIVNNPVTEYATAISTDNTQLEQEIIKLKVRLAQLENIVDNMQHPLVWQDLSAAEQTV